MSLTHLSLEKLDPLALLPVRDKAFAALRDALCRGDFQPGQMVTIQSLAASLGLGSTPVRDAVQQLVSDHALELLANRRLRVPLISGPQLKDIFAIRWHIEGAAARRAAFHMRNHVEALDHARRALSASRLRGDTQGALDANRRFHFLIYRAAGSPTLYVEIERLWTRIGPLLIGPFQEAPGEFAARCDELHAQLTAALQAGAPLLAERLMRDIIRAGYKWQRSRWRRELTAEQPG